MIYINLDEALQIIIGILGSKDSHKRFEEYVDYIVPFFKILEFMYEFDIAKVNTPSIQNDISFYRRMLRGKHNTTVTENECNDISMFFEMVNPATYYVTSTLPSKIADVFFT